MSRIMADLRLILRSRLAVAALALLALLSSLSLSTGLHAVEAQRETIVRVQAAHAADLAGVRKTYGGPEAEAGYAAYYGFQLTWDPPSPLAFTALGQRDVQPYTLRVRALGLHGQLYEGENVNAELALPGRFDFAFVLVYLAPLVVVALMHDLQSGEREAGRLRLLRSMPGAGALWVRRTGLRVALVLLALLLPLAVALVTTGTFGPAALGILLVAVFYIVFWSALALGIAAGARSSASSAATLLASWLMLTLLLPALASAAIARGVPAAKGVDLMLAHREVVHGAWDRPKSWTFDRFFVNHSEWRHTPPVTGRFHWKWYYAFHQVGDEAVAADVAAYRRSLALRQLWTERVGWLLPAAGAQVLLHRLADTDLAAHLAYQDRIADHHRRLRLFFYPYLFDERPFLAADWDALPRFTPRASSTTAPPASFVALVTIAGIAAAFAASRVRRGGGRSTWLRSLRPAGAVPAE